MTCNIVSGKIQCQIWHSRICLVVPIFQFFCEWWCLVESLVLKGRQKRHKNLCNKLLDPTQKKPRTTKAGVDRPKLSSQYVRYVYKTWTPDICLSLNAVHGYPRHFNHAEQCNTFQSTLLNWLIIVVLNFWYMSVNSTQCK